MLHQPCYRLRSACAEIANLKEQVRSLVRSATRLRTELADEKEVNIGLRNKLDAMDEKFRVPAVPTPNARYPEGRYFGVRTALRAWLLDEIEEFKDDETVDELLDVVITASLLIAFVPFRQHAVDRYEAKRRHRGQDLRDMEERILKALRSGLRDEASVETQLLEARAQRIARNERSN